MGSIVTPQKITVLEKNGECKVHITLDINININNNSPSNNSITLEAKNIEEEEEKTVWEVPSFSKAEKIKFGKRKE